MNECEYSKYLKLRKMFVNNKRSRSRSSSRTPSRSQSRESTISKRQKTEQQKDLLSKAMSSNSSPKVSCAFCNRDITKSIKIICAVCTDSVIYCIECLIHSKGDQSRNPHCHDYYIVDKLNFPLISKDWTVQEELQLLSGIEKFGLDNWGDISDNITTKARVECEAHYYKYYYKAQDEYLPTEKDVILKSRSEDAEIEINEKKAETHRKSEDEMKKSIVENVGRVPEFTSNTEHKNHRSRSLVKNRNKKDQSAITSASEVLGYWPKREEFDIEFLNDAELEIAELEFLDEDTEAERNLKINVLKVYNAQLEEREKRKKFVIERNLLDVKKQMNFERKLSKEDREIYNCLKPFARFLDNSQFYELFEGMVLEKNLRQRLNQLKQYKKLGMKTYDEIERYLELDCRAKREEKKSNGNGNGNGGISSDIGGAVYEGLGERISRYLKNSGNKE